MSSRTTLGAIGYLAFVAAGVLMASPLLTMAIPWCPSPGGHLFYTGVASGLVAWACFALERKER
jgi:hypothetical protein